MNPLKDFIQSVLRTESALCRNFIYIEAVLPEQPLCFFKALFFYVVGKVHAGLFSELLGKGF